MRKVIAVEGKRPADATPEMALKMVEAGMSQTELARAWNITRGRVCQLVKKAKEAQAKATALNPE